MRVRALPGILAAVRSRPFWSGRLVPWLWLLPALVFIGIFLVYPAVDTFRLSLMNANSSEFVGPDNYAYVFTTRSTQNALLNNILWLVLFTLLSVGLGLIIAVFSGRVRYEAVAKAAIFIPMAISFVAAAVIWRFVYAYRPPGFEQIGLANAVADAAGLEPTAWLIEQQVPYSDVLFPAPIYTNNLAIIIVGVWMWTGFAMVILSAGLKGIPTEVMEAARVDGANEWQMFWRIVVPILNPTIVVVATTLVIQALKKFDMVWVMTAGNYGTDVVATLMFKQMFNFRDFGVSSALAVVLLVAVFPAMVYSIRRFQRQEEGR